MSLLTLCVITLQSFQKTPKAHLFCPSLVTLHVVPTRPETELCMLSATCYVHFYQAEAAALQCRACRRKTERAAELTEQCMALACIQELRAKSTLLSTQHGRPDRPAWWCLRKSWENSSSLAQHTNTNLLLAWLSFQYFALLTYSVARQQQQHSDVCCPFIVELSKADWSSFSVCSEIFIKVKRRRNRIILFVQENQSKLLQDRGRAAAILKTVLPCACIKIQEWKPTDRTSGICVRQVSCDSSTIAARESFPVWFESLILILIWFEEIRRDKQNNKSKCQRRPHPQARRPSCPRQSGLRKVSVNCQRHCHLSASWIQWLQVVSYSVLSLIDHRSSIFSMRRTSVLPFRKYLVSCLLDLCNHTHNNRRTQERGREAHVVAL